MSALKWLPPALANNPVWVAFGTAVERVWYEELDKPTLELLNLHLLDLANVGREDLLKTAYELGWTFTDSFTADWENNPVAENFVRQFVKTWAEFCTTKGDSSFIDYMSMLLQLPVTLHVLWTNAKDSSFDGVEQDYTNLSAANLPAISYGTLLRPDAIADLDPNWKTIIEDPVSGWYPTTHVEIEYDSEAVALSLVNGSPPNGTIRNIFNVVAPAEYVLQNVISIYDSSGDDAAKVLISTTNTTRIIYGDPSDIFPYNTEYTLNDTIPLVS